MTQQDYQTRYNNLLKFVITCLVVTMCIQFYTIYQAAEDARQKQSELAVTQMELAYLQGKYQEYYGFIDTPRGERLIRLVSIDGGNNWVEISRDREILQPAYLHQRYPQTQLADITPLQDRTR